MIFLNDHALNETETIPKAFDFSKYSVWQIQWKEEIQKTTMQISFNLQRQHFRNNLTS